MPDLTAGNEVLELALRMEEVARDFYESLGLASDDSKVREFCLMARREEANHWVIFENMRREWTRSHQARLLPPEALEALQTLACDRTCPDASKVQQVALGGTLASALELALEMERDSIRLYEDMRRTLPDLAETLDDVLAEERKHVSRLQALAGTVGATR